MNASQGAHSIVMSCEAPADERDCELGRSLVLIQFKDFYFLQIATEEGSRERDGEEEVCTGENRRRKVPITIYGIPLVYSLCMFINVVKNFFFQKKA